MSPTSSTNKPENDEKNSSIVKPPSSFDGSHSKYRDWIRQVKLFHRGKHLTTADDKIMSTLSYMMEGSAATWAQRYADDHLDSPSMGKWDEFAAELDSSFKDHMATKKARDKVEHFVQGKVLTDEFMNSFEMLLADAELSDDAEQIRLLEKNVNRSIIDTIYGSGNLPSNFGDYKKRVLKIGRLWEQRREQRYSCDPAGHVSPSATNENDMDFETQDTELLSNASLPPSLCTRCWNCDAATARPGDGRSLHFGLQQAKIAVANTGCTTVTGAPSASSMAARLHKLQEMESQQHIGRRCEVPKKSQWQRRALGLSARSGKKEQGLMVQILIPQDKNPMFCLTLKRLEILHEPKIPKMRPIRFLILRHAIPLILRSGSLHDFEIVLTGLFHFCGHGLIIVIFTRSIL